MSQEIKLLDYLELSKSTVEATLVAYQKEHHHKISREEQLVFIEKFIKAIKKENAKGNLYDQNFDLPAIVRRVIDETMSLDRFKRMEPKIHVAVN